MVVEPDRVGVGEPRAAVREVAREALEQPRSRQSRGISITASGSGHDPCAAWPARVHPFGVDLEVSQRRGQRRPPRDAGERAHLAAVREEVQPVLRKVDDDDALWCVDGDVVGFGFTTCTRRTLTPPPRARRPLSMMTRLRPDLVGAPGGRHPGIVPERQERHSVQMRRPAAAGRRPGRPDALGARWRRGARACQRHTRAVAENDRRGAHGDGDVGRSGGATARRRSRTRRGTSWVTRAHAVRGDAVRWSGADRSRQSRMRRRAGGSAALWPRRCRVSRSASPDLRR